jgi:hypothetical protein
MNPSPENHEQRLEQLMRKTLQGLPSRRAPGSLEERVLAELARRAALPWWRKSYIDWPLPARCAFLLVSGGVAKLAIMAVVWVMLGFETAPLLERFRALADLGDSIIEFCQAVLHSIPPFWIYGGLAVIALMYATLVGVGAFAYRTFHTRR